jgi:hypothetical protein
VKKSYFSISLLLDPYPGEPSQQGSGSELQESSARNLCRDMDAQVGGHVGVHVAETVERAQAQVEQKSAKYREMTG